MAVSYAEARIEIGQLQKEHAEAEALKEDRRHDLARRLE